MHFCYLSVSCVAFTMANHIFNTFEMFESKIVKSENCVLCQQIVFDGYVECYGYRYFFFLGFSVALSIFLSLLLFLFSFNVVIFHLIGNQHQREEYSSKIEHAKCVECYLKLSQFQSADSMLETNKTQRATAKSLSK